MLKTNVIYEIAKQHGTPLYIFDKTALAKRVAQIKEILGEDVTLCYAMKANPFLVDAFKSLDTKFEVCSPGEFAICERENVDMKQIVLSGVNKEESDICHVMDDCGGVGIYTVESRGQLNLINRCAGERGIVANVILRVTSGNQFGMGEADICDIAAHKDDYANVKMRGLQCYSGTQKKKTDIFVKELNRLHQLSDKLNDEYGCELDELEYGPGLSYAYFGEDAYGNNFDELKVLASELDDIKRKYHVTLEMGRYLAAECGIYVTSVADIKVNDGQNYVIVDGGINHVNYYGQTMAMKIPAYSYVKYTGEVVKDGIQQSDDSVTGKLEQWTVCGSLCTVADVIVKNLPIGKPDIADLIIFRNIGAYSVTEGIYLFLSRRMPKIIAVSYEDAYADVAVNVDAYIDVNVDVNVDADVDADADVAVCGDAAVGVNVEVYRDTFATDVLNSRKCCAELHIS